MNNRLFRYEDFISESRIEMLFEAKMQYASLFRKILQKIDSPVAKALLDLAGEEVDVNTNFVEADREKEDVVFFKPDDKAAKAAKVNRPGAHYDIISAKVLGEYYRVPNAGQVGEIEKRLNAEELKRDYNVTQPSFISELVVFKWRDSSGIGKCIFSIDSLVLGSEAVNSAEIGVGKFARNVLKSANIEFLESDIEDFVYKYRSEIASLGGFDSMFRILKGEDIRTYYNSEKYLSDKGTLGNSCMRYEGCQKFLDIYVLNPEVCSMVALMSDDGADGEDDDKIRGRALLWTDSEGRKIMDRIYTNRTQDEQLFKDFAKKKGFFCKLNQNSSSDDPFVSPSGEEEELTVRIPIVSEDYDYYPYMDTFKYLVTGKYPYLTNEYRSSGAYTLTETDGGNGDSCHVCDDGREVECPECWGRGGHQCDNCGGEGTLECDSCGGMHEMDCPECDGSGEDEEGNECSRCEGKGNYECDECGGRDIECGECDGEGRNECWLCSGDGAVSCPECG